MSDRSNTNRPPRTQTELRAVLIDSHGTQIPVTIVDLSAHGFRLRTPERLEEGEQVRLTSGKGEGQAARILWVRSGEAGGIFLLPPEQPR